LNSSLELSVYKLIINSSIFTKLILGVLLIISIISWAIMLHKYLFINTYKSQTFQFLKTLTSQANPAYIEDSCMHFSSGCAKTMPILLLRLIRSRNQGKLNVSPEAILNNAAMHEANKLRKGMGILATSANISPLIGLLGTVWGVMYSFISIGQQGSANIAVVAPGIAEALMTTIAGLCVAIPAMAGHNFLSGWINLCLDFIDRISEYALTILQ
jgi:biopolymer transport protein TolQ